MSVNEMLINALSAIAPAYPYEIDEDNGNERDLRRIVFNYDTITEAFGDDVPVFDRYLLQVHYFCPYNDDSLDARMQIKVGLIAAGFTYPRETAVSSGVSSRNMSEEQHFCFETELLMPAGEVDDIG